MGVVWASVLGGYPRSRPVRLALRDRERGAVGWGQDVELVRAGAAAVIGAQLAAGMRFVVDGMLDWHDIFRPFAVAWRNVSLGGLLRYFDNNFFYRIPVFHDKPEPSDPVLAPRVRWALDVSWPAGVKAVMPGPVTFARLAENRSRLSVEELAESIAVQLGLEARLAAEAGASVVQVDEPFLADVDATPDDARLAVELAARIRGEARVPVWLAVYFGFPEAKVYEALLDAKVDYVSLDVIDQPARAMEVIGAKGYGGWRPVLGLVDARQIYDDDLGKLEDLAARLAGGVEELGLTTSTWLDLIPYRYSLRKTALLGRLAERLAERLGYRLETPLRHV